MGSAREKRNEGRSDFGVGKKEHVGEGGILNQNRSSKRKKVEGIHQRDSRPGGRKEKTIIRNLTRREGAFKPSFLPGL